MKNKKLKEELVSQRVFFKSSKLREQFFTKLKNNFGTWGELGQRFNIYKSRLELLRSGEISLPYQTFIQLLNSLGTKDRSFFKEQVVLKDHGWGRIKGGISTYKKHKEIFEKGRKLAILNITPRYKFDYNISLTPELCEFIGAFIGDGFTGRYGSIYVTQITGHKILDRNYFTNKLQTILKNINPNSNPIIRIMDRDNSIRLTINSKEFHVLLNGRFKLPKGKKSYLVKMPEEIIKSGNYKLINSCLRGIFDTDGCVAFDRRDAYSKPYIRIVLQMMSKELINQIYGLLLRQGINPTITKEGRVIQINGAENCKRFVEKIGFSNSRHLNKLKSLTP